MSVWRAHCFPVGVPRVLRAALVVCMLTAGSCGKSPASPDPPPPTATGTWRGVGTDAVENSQFTWVFTQSGSSVTGTGTYVGVRSNFAASGPVTGTVSGNVVTFSASLTFEVPFQFCSASISGTAQMDATALIGSYTGTNTCEGGPFSSGQFALTRQ